MLKDPIIAAIRTGVATGVGFVVAFLVAQGFELDAEFTIGLTTALTALCTAAYNWLVITLEENWGPKWGVLLGYAKSPKYNG